ncbi:MAG: sigma-70 family RNA polymerase sigma factor [Rhodothermales bacterium]|nr:sigma-70 family RNA polymerase sigma factor [Rhodothermales bacterium]
MSRPDILEQIDLEALLSGDHDAFEQLVENESARLFRVIMRVLNNEEEARNVLQETFLQAYQRLGTFRRESKVTTWLYAIGINLARAARRKLTRYETLSEEDLDRLQPKYMVGMRRERYQAWDPQKLIESDERKRIVHETILRLPEDYRIVVTLRDIEEMSTSDVASMLDISEGAVRVRLHRARLALKKLLTAELK